MVTPYHLDSHTLRAPWRQVGKQILNFALIQVVEAKRHRKVLSGAPEDVVVIHEPVARELLTVPLVGPPKKLQGATRLGPLDPQTRSIRNRFQDAAVFQKRREPHTNDVLPVGSVKINGLFRT